MKTIIKEKKYIKNLRNEIRDSKKALELKRKKANKVIKQLAKELYSKGAKKVWLFGSYSNDYIRDDSDIDMAVSGLTKRIFNFFLIKKYNYKGFSIDYINFDESDDYFKNMITERGKLL